MQVGYGWAILLIHWLCQRGYGPHTPGADQGATDHLRHLRLPPESSFNFFNSLTIVSSSLLRFPSALVGHLPICVDEVVSLLYLVGAFAIATNPYLIARRANKRQPHGRVRASEQNGPPT